MKPMSVVLLVFPGMGFLAHKNIEEAKIRSPVEKGSAHVFGLILAINPTIGVFGVAPKQDEVPTDTPDNHGGNIDAKDITACRTLYFPVEQEGALFALDDCHALMGDGEIDVTGLKIAPQVKYALS